MGLKLRGSLPAEAAAAPGKTTRRELGDVAGGTSAADPVARNGTGALGLVITSGRSNFCGLMRIYGGGREEAPARPCAAVPLRGPSGRRERGILAGLHLGIL